MQHTRIRKIIIAAAVLVVVVAVFFSQQNTCCAAEPESEDIILERISPQEYQTRFASQGNHLLLDVRTPQEFASGHIMGAHNIAVETLAQRLSEIPRDQPVVIYCRSGNRSATAAQILASAGYAAIYDLGGVIAWTAAGLPLE